MRRGKDPCCVLTSELGPIVRAFAEQWASEHEDLADRSIQNDLGHFCGQSALGAVALIQERTSLVNGGLGVGRATIRNVLKERNHTTELWIADALLQAVGALGALGAGEGARVRIIPNRHASGAARARAARRGMPECCSGSAVAVARGRSAGSAPASLLA